MLELFDAAVVGWAVFCFFREAACAGWGWWDIARAEEPLPVCAVRTGLASPAAGVGDAVALPGRRSKPASRAITALSQRMVTPQQQA